MPFRTRPRSSLVLSLTAWAVGAAFIAGQAGALARQTGNDWSDWAGVPGPEECATGPVDAESFVQGLLEAAASPVPGDIPLQVNSIDDLPTGEPVSEDEATGALTTVRELFACVNAGKFGSVLALFTAEGIVTLTFGAAGLDAASLSDEELTEALQFFLPIIAAPATPAAQGSQVGLIEITDVRKLADGRILVVSVGDATGTQGEGFVVLEEVDGRWLVDAVGAIGEIDAPDIGA